MKTVWVIGGPGCGKGTQCDRIIKKYGFLHLSSGDLLRDEVASGSPRGASLQELMSKGLFVPTVCPVDLILFFDVSNETMTKRLLGRAAVSQRADDNAETIKKRIEIFNQKNGEIVQNYESKVVRVWV
ncbi:hypothetical protein M0802_007378 [Mischocyttarus mexicanus]|nr:hypothetical protein M0802_007378 [Mischocyttarus mexicanus]